jgi:glyoxylase-like metal-dependent hydrolase (beta-lactamase superfamily II)
MSSDYREMPALLFEDGPAISDAIEIAPGLFWARLPLPYAPFHVNTYLIEDHEGWIAVETGLNDAATHHAWDAILAGPLKGGRLSRVLPTHWHSDHLGSAGWLCERFSAPLLMSECEYLTGVVYQQRSVEDAKALRRTFFLEHGLGDAGTETWISEGYRYLDMMAPLPRHYVRLYSGDVLRTARSEVLVHTVPGHSPEEVNLYDRSNGFYFCADQLTPRLAPNLAVQPHEPYGNPLALFMGSLDSIDELLSVDAVVLPAHEVPYRGARARTRELREYYGQRCEVVMEACQSEPRSATELIRYLWRRPPSPVWIGFIVSEIVSYLNYLVDLGQMERVRVGNVLHHRAKR